MLIEIPKEISKELKIFKLQNDFDTQQQAILYIITEKLIGENENDMEE